MSIVTAAACRQRALAPCRSVSPCPHPTGSTTTAPRTALLVGELGAEARRDVAVVLLAAAGDEVGAHDVVRLQERVELDELGARGGGRPLVAEVGAPVHVRDAAGHRDASLGIAVAVDQVPAGLQHHDRVVALVHRKRQGSG